MEPPHPPAHATAEPARAPTYVVLGAGGLGCPALLGLVASGAQNLVLVDDDVVDPSNLQRQILYRHQDRGRAKVEVARERLGASTPIEHRQMRISTAGLGRLLDDIPRPRIVLECTDSPELKFAANDWCLRDGTGLVIGGVLGWRGQVMAVAPGSACFRCLFEEPPPAELAPNCATAGVVGTAAGTIGFWMALLALRLGSEHAVAGTLMTIDLRTLRTAEISASRRADCPACATSRIHPPPEASNP